ncbi:vicilin-like seed storage protein At2g18540 [Temnothorax curvispinosus]|uniref:Vicilin-like seed storage protein At2g18540 n=1 Tax=Temnothorax curvispinosus TaxID=300111 RepID=A0A6J1QM84_9HYME|nr:vicilin-like seed storage protein At2g18540 [Temnothorax curvispinosus]
MDKEKEIESESAQQGDKGKKGEGEGEKKARGRPTKAEELAKLRRTDSTGSVKEFFQKSEKRKREEEVEEAANAEEEILKEFNAQRRVNRSPPPKIKKEKQGKENMATEELLEKERKEKTEKLIEEINRSKMAVEEVQEIGHGEFKMKVLRCRNWDNKREIMMRKKELGKKYGCFLNDDLTKEEKQIQKELRKIARKKREAGKWVTVGYQKIWEDNKEWRWNENKEALEERDHFRR